VNGFINGRVHWEHPEGKQAVEAALKTSAPAKRAELYQQYYRILAAPATPFVGLVQWEVRFPARSNIDNFNYHPLYYFEIDRRSGK
jgi:ABC-type transport system substrate-binding protein